MIARVTLEIALRREFDYSIPPELDGEIEVGTRVKVPFGAREVTGCVTALVDQSRHANLRPISKVIGGQSFITPKVLELARWIANYYCCPIEVAVKSLLPEAVRKEEAGWKEQLVVRALPRESEVPKLNKRQNEIWKTIQTFGQIPLRELIEKAGTTADTVRRLEDRGLISIAPEISERDPYAHEKILPTAP